MSNIPSSIESIHIVQRMAPGGIETLVTDLVASGDGRDWIFSLSGSADELIAGWPALAKYRDRLIAFDAKPGLNPMLIARIADALRQKAPRAVVVHHIGPLLYGGLAAKLSGVPTIIHVEHDVWHYDIPRRRMISGLLERLIRPHHVAVSHDAARKIADIMPGARITVIPNGIDMSRFERGNKARARQARYFDLSWKIVGTAGRLVAVKAQDVLIRAAALMDESVHIVIAGDGPERPTLQVLAIQLGVAERVHFLGHCDSVESVLPAFDVFCLPSHAEGFPRSVIEAQAVGLPVVATDVGALREALCPESSRLAPPGDAASLARELTLALAQSSERNPRTFVEERYSWTNTVAAYRSLMEQPHAT